MIAIIITSSFKIFQMAVAQIQGYVPFVCHGGVDTSWCYYLLHQRVHWPRNAHTNP